ncbi:unnamed protein product [Colias eurytheme]|nr:unnamed protein product [Colias eurytheme]
MPPPPYRRVRIAGTRVPGPGGNKCPPDPLKHFTFLNFVDPINRDARSQPSLPAVIHCQLNGRRCRRIYDGSLNFPDCRYLYAIYSRAAGSGAARDVGVGRCSSRRRDRTAMNYRVNV